MAARRVALVLVAALLLALGAVPATAQTASVEITGSGAVNARNADDYVVSGTATAGAALEVEVSDADGGMVTATATADVDGSFAVPLDLSGLVDGDVTIEVATADGADVEVVVKDTDAPAPPQFTLDPLTPLNIDAYVIVGTAENGATIRATVIDENGEQVSAEVVAGTDGSFTLPALDLSDLVEGRLIVTVEAIDPAGNVSVEADLLGGPEEDPAPSVAADPVGEGDEESTFPQPEGDLTVVFDGLTGDGVLTVVRGECDPEQAPHGMRLLDVCYDITLSGTADFESAQVTLPYSDQQLTDAGIADEADLVAVHFGSGGRVDDITEEVDEAANQVSGTVTELGTFAVGAYNLERLFGVDRIETAARISAATFAPGVDVAFVATARDFPDALTGGPAAAGLGAPILLVDQGVPAATDAELRRLGPGRIVVLGGEAAVSAAVESALDGYTDGSVTRLAGADRYGTAAAISQSQHGPGVATVYVATGGNFPDALAGGAAAADEDVPLLLVDAGVPQATATELTRLGPGRIVVLGGPVAVSADVEAALRGYTSGEVVRLAGADRYETAARVAASFAEVNDPVFVATGEAFPDALSGTPAAGMAGGPLVLVARTALPAAIAGELEGLDPSRAVVLGGSVAVDVAVEEALEPFLRE